MTLRLVGFFLTSAAVIVLLGSAVLGLRGPAMEGGWEPVSVTRPQLEGERIRVEVLNGAGISGLAQSVTERLRERGFDVVYFGNAGRLARDSTVVLDRGINPEAAEKIAEALGIARIEVVPDTSLYLEATVILARDWEEIDRRN